MTVEPQFEIGNIVSINSDSLPPDANPYVEGEVVGFRPDGPDTKHFVVVQLSRDVQGIYRPHELTLV